MTQSASTDDLAALRGCVAAVGNFDGVHSGHQAMIGELRRQADTAGVCAVAITFDPAPVELLRPEAAPPRLTSVARKKELLIGAGADDVLVLPTDKRLLNLSAEEFFRDVLVGRLAVHGLVEGPNFRFGRDRHGDVALLNRLCAASGRTLTVVEPVHVAGQMVSSSLVRQHVSAARLVEAAAMLGRPHEACGVVGRGAARGRGLGFPTANLEGISTLLPPDGVYAGRARLADAVYQAAIHIGANSTFGEQSRTFETHLLGFSGELYGQTLRVNLIEKLRETKRFASSTELVAQLEEDCRRVRERVAAP